MSHDLPRRLCRHRTLVLVCHHWWRMAHAPQLLASVDLPPVENFEQLDSSHVARRLRSLVEWLVRRAAPHVRRLCLTLDTQQELDTDVAAECTALCVAAVSSCHRLEDLLLDLRCMELPLSSWLLPVAGSLRHLTFNCFNWYEVDVTTTLTYLIALESLDLGRRCSGVVLDAAARLPVLLTRLDWHSNSREQDTYVPHQVGCVL